MNENFKNGFEKVAYENADQDPKNLKWHEKHRPAASLLLGEILGLYGGHKASKALTKSLRLGKTPSMLLGSGALITGGILGGIGGLAAGIGSLGRDKQIARMNAARQSDKKLDRLLKQHDRNALR